MLRLCYNNLSVKLIKKADGTFSISGLYPQDTENVRYMMQLTASHNFTFTKNLIGCYESLKKNKSDFSYGQFLYFDSTNTYHVPVQIYTARPYFISGYEVNSYVESQRNKSDCNYGLMNNIYNYQVDVHCLVLLLLICLLSLLMLQKSVKTHLVKSKSTFYRRVRTTKCPRVSRLGKFLHHLAFFFVSTPFLLMFKTNQVVTERPFVLETYQMIMNAGARIRTSGMYTNVSMTLEPNSDNNERKDLIYKMYHYFIHHQYRGAPPGKNRSYFDSLFEIAESIINKTMVYLDTYWTVKTMRLVFCSISRDSQLYRAFIFKDVHSREFLAGNAFRLGFEDKKLVKRLRNTFEAASTIVWSRMHPLPLGFKFRGKSISNKHRKSQLELCLDEELKPYERHETFASGVSFFGSFFALLLAIDTCSFLLLLLEVVYCFLDV